MSSYHYVSKAEKLGNEQVDTGFHRVRKSLMERLEAGTITPIERVLLTLVNDLSRGAPEEIIKRYHPIPSPDDPTVKILNELKFTSKFRSTLSKYFISQARED